MNCESSKCDFCKEVKIVSRQYLNAKNPAPGTDAFVFFYYCNDCGLEETVKRNTGASQTPTPPKQSLQVEEVYLKQCQRCLFTEEDIKIDGKIGCEKFGVNHHFEIFSTGGKLASLKNKNWRDNFDEKFKGYWMGKSIPDELKFFISTLLHKERAELLREVYCLGDKQSEILPKLEWRMRINKYASEKGITI